MKLNFPDSPGSSKSILFGSFMVPQIIIIIESHHSLFIIFHYSLHCCHFHLGLFFCVQSKFSSFHSFLSLSKATIRSHTQESEGKSVRWIGISIPEFENKVFHTFSIFFIFFIPGEFLARKIVFLWWFWSKWSWVLFFCGCLELGFTDFNKILSWYWYWVIKRKIIFYFILCVWLRLIDWCYLCNHWSSKIRNKHALWYAVYESWIIIFLLLIFLYLFFYTFRFVLYFYCHICGMRIYGFLEKYCY